MASISPGTLKFKAALERKYPDKKIKSVKRIRYDCGYWVLYAHTPIKQYFDPDQVSEIMNRK